MVVFDLGKVLLDFDFALAARRIACLSRFRPDQITHFWKTTPWLFQYETGLIDRLEFFNRTRDAAGFSGSLDQFCGYFADIFTPIESMIELHSQLRQTGFPTYIFSNTNDIAIGHVRQEFPFFSEFDGYILSYQHRAMKPDPQLYAVVEAQTGRRGSQVFYLDDRPENIRAGAERGWIACLHQSPERTWTEARNLGLIKTK